MAIRPLQQLNPVRFQFDPLGAFAQGQGIAQRGQQFEQQGIRNERENRIAQLREEIAQLSNQPGTKVIDSSAFRELAALDGPGAAQTASTFQGISDERKRDFFQSARRGLDFLNAGRIEELDQLARDRLAQLPPGSNRQDTQFIIDNIASGNLGAIRKVLESTIESGINFGFLKDPAERRKRADQRTPAQKDFSDFQRLIDAAAAETDPERRRIAALKATQFGRRGRFIKETEQEKSDIAIRESERKAMAKVSVARKNVFIDNGVAAADSTANIRRAISLLDGVETGGIDAVLNRAKQIFGIESANEAELSAALGKSVLAQLRPLFGAAFTAAEGDRLIRIEAGFGKSTAGNKRLLKQTLQIANRAARRGLSAAEELGEGFSADEIKNALAFTLDEKALSPSVPSQAAQISPTATTGQQLNEGDIITNQQTGERLIVSGGQLVPFNG